jgi:formamidopyrimidine-DNA glycosylase
MPELPDVEVVRRKLARLRGATIVRVESSDKRVFQVRTSLVHHVIRQVGRRGKWLRLELDEGLVFSHLGMTGDWVLRSAAAPALPFERVRMDVEKGGRITSARYTDPRRFGRFVASARDIDAWRELGPDPLLDGIDPERVLAVLTKRRRTIKEVLLEQSLLAGVGNILAIEALWSAKIDPRTRANLLNARDVREIAKGLRAVIARAIAHDEKSIETTRRVRGPFRIYGRAKQPCPRCGTALRQVVLGGRGTTFCPGCQKAHWRAETRRPAVSAR